MKLSRRLLFSSFFALVAVLSMGSALADECASAPMRADNGDYLGCEIVHGADVQFRDPESIDEAACPRVCEALNEIDELAAESRALDVSAGVAE